MSRETTNLIQNVPGGWIRIERRSLDGQEGYEDIQMSHIVNIHQNHLEGFSVRVSGNAHHWSSQHPLGFSEDPNDDVYHYGWVRILEEDGQGNKLIRDIQLSHVVSIVRVVGKKTTVHLSNGNHYDTDVFPPLEVFAKGG